MANSDLRLISNSLDRCSWGGWLVFERKDGRQYESEVTWFEEKNPRISSIYAVGDKRKVCVWSRKIGIEIEKLTLDFLKEINNIQPTP